MRQVLRTLSGLTLLTLLAACQSAPMPAMMAPAPGMFRAPLQNMQNFSAVQNQGDLVGVQGFRSGDNLDVRGPLWFKGKGKVHNLTPDAFKIEFQIASHHLIVDAVRLDAQRVRFTTVDVKGNRTVEAIGTYQRNGNTTVFDMGKGQEVEKLTVRGIRPGYFETDVVQAGRMYPSDERGSTTLKFSKAN
ncbi:MAG: hypothetical protein IGS03_00070 [Candidatus Sericytochromatia bacterium]|nr:hypothetical protein [Candidatus Sericytochromatia bacterium]